jgi:hypothetical protein
MDSSKEFLKKCVRFFWQNNDVIPFYLKVYIDNSDGNSLYINKNYNIYYAGELIPFNNLEDLSIFIDENIPVIRRIYLQFKYPILKGSSYIDSNGDNLSINYKLFDQGEYFFGCDLQNIHLKFKLIARIIRIFSAIYVQEDLLKTLLKVVKLKNDNTKMESEIKKRQDQIKNYDQTGLNDRIINLIEFAKLNEKPKTPIPPRAPSTRRSPGKQPGFYRGMAFGNTPLKLNDLRIQLTEITNNPFKHTCGIQELRLNRELSQFRDLCNNVLKDLKTKIKIITDDLGLKDLQLIKMNKKILEEERIKTQNIIDKHHQLNVKNMNLHDEHRRHKKLVKNIGDRVKLSTSFTNQRFKYLSKERLKKQEQKLLEDNIQGDQYRQIFGFGKSKKINLKSLKMDLKKVVKRSLL